jgi:two-component system chemotaxis response regulator CheB
MSLPPLRRARVLVVDDAATVRTLVADVLSRQPGIEVVGVAASGRIALAKIQATPPDLVTLDFEMPEMDGLAALAAIRELDPTLPVIMLSAHTERGAVVTVEALASGARDYVTKPTGHASREEAERYLVENLVPKVLALARRHTAMPRPPDGVETRGAAVRLPHQMRRDRVEVVAIGASTGGPAALTTILRALPADLRVPLVIVQHMPPAFTRLFSERLSAESCIPIQEANPGGALWPGRGWLAAGGRHLVVERSGCFAQALATDGLPENSCKPSVDVLFRSVAELFGRHALAVVLTGMGRDGVAGCERIKTFGGTVIVQDQATSVVWGMPGLVAQAGLADEILPLESLADAICARARGSRPDAGVLGADGAGAV